MLIRTHTLTPLTVLCSVVASCAPTISQGWAVLPSLLHALRDAAGRVVVSSFSSPPVFADRRHATFSTDAPAPGGGREGSNADSSGPIVAGICDAVQRLVHALHKAMQGRSRTLQVCVCAHVCVCACVRVC